MQTIKHSISLGMKMISGVSISGGVVLARAAIIEMRLALPLQTLQPYVLICRCMAPLSAASVRPRSAADCLIRSAVDISHPRQQGNPRAGSSVTSNPVSQWCHYQWPWCRRSRGGWQSFAFPWQGYWHCSWLCCLCFYPSVTGSRSLPADAKPSIVS